MELTSRLMIMAASSSAGPASGYWFATLGAAASEEGIGVRVGSDDSLYLNARSNSGFMYAVKYDPDGTLSWQRVLTLAAQPNTGRLAIDSSDNVYFIYTDTSTSASSWFAAGYNSSGGLLWQKQLNANNRGTFSGNSSVCYGLDVYMSAARISQLGELAGGNATSSLLKLTASTGAVVWANNTFNKDNYNYALTADTSGSLYMAHEVDQDATTNISQLAVSKFTTSGSRLWSSSVRGAAYSAAGYTFYYSSRASDIAVDSSGNIYAVGSLQNASTTTPAIYKYNSSGTLQWAKILGTASGSFNGVTIDSSNNVYACGSIGSLAVIASYDGSGNINWQRTFNGGVSEAFQSAAIDSNGDLCLVGNTASDGQGSSDIFIVKIPSDGSLTGTYGNFTYATSSYTNGTGTVSAYSPSITTYSQSVTVTNSSFAEAAGGLVSESTDL